MFREKIETSSFSVASRLPPFLCKFSDTTFRQGHTPRTFEQTNIPNKSSTCKTPQQNIRRNIQNITSPDNVRTEHYTETHQTPRNLTNASPDNVRTEHYTKLTEHYITYNH